MAREKAKAWRDIDSNGSSTSDSVIVEQGHPRMDKAVSKFRKIKPGRKLKRNPRLSYVYSKCGCPCHFPLKTLPAFKKKPLKNGHTDGYWDQIEQFTRSSRKKIDKCLPEESDDEFDDLKVYDYSRRTTLSLPSEEYVPGDKDSALKTDNVNRAFKKFSKFAEEERANKAKKKESKMNGKSDLPRQNDHSGEQDDNATFHVTRKPKPEKHSRKKKKH